ncbi:MAG: hydrolase [Dehalococcoidales bacterium]|jgi:predicted amidohydrolase|nr:hydrolase [Dehalococcoidales bacterium]MDP6448496.1 carbon-nitrogen hydrolase family protein [Dehalococcoidales bacterium]MDP6577171.1 carbon-nitrogen hydrolase family protein [Dehalococcoidales bacterium]
MTSKVTVGVVQMHSGDDKQSNLAKAEALLDDAIGKGAGFIALPEIFNICGNWEVLKANAEPVPGPTTDRLCRKARESRIYLLGGSMPEIAEGTEKVFNTSVLIDPSGEVIARYRKIHLFDVTIGDRVVIKESDAMIPGDELVTAETGYGTVGLTICYDLRFPEIYRELAVRGAKLIFIPSSFMEATGKDHWSPLLRARAIENQVFIVAPNEIGPIPGTKMLRYGHSAIIDPWGTLLAQASDTEGVITAELDFDYLLKVRRELPSLAHRRPRVYSRG